MNEQMNTFKRRKDVQGTEGRGINSMWADVRNCLGLEVIFEAGFEGRIGVFWMTTVGGKRLEKTTGTRLEKD